MLPLRVTLLGAMDVRDASGAGLDAVLAQPKRAALLAYLAATQPLGYRRRDSILALFWPELSERRARDALNSALYFLRRSLGEGVIVGRGADEIGIADGTLWCDLVAFNAAIAAGDDRAAMELVRAELLSGLIVGDAPEFDDWLSRERERLRASARDAAHRLAKGAAAGGDTGDAVRWARRASEIAPDDESVFRTLLLAMEQDGDVAGGLRLFDNFAAHLRRTYELEPSAQTVALVAAMRERHRRASAVSDMPPTPPTPPTRPTLSTQAEQPSAPPTGASVASSASPLASTSGRRTVQLRGAWGLQTAAVVGGLLAVAVATTTLGKRLQLARDEEGTERGDAQTALAVFPFSYHGSENGLFLGEGVARLLGTSLDGTGDLRVVDPRALLGAARGADSATSAASDESRWHALARTLRATWYVSGEIEASGDSLDVRAALHESRGRARVIAGAHVRAAKDELFGVVDQLALQLIAALPATPGARIERVAARTTSSLPALRFYLAGEGEFRRGRFAEAIDAFRSAVAADSMFALAFYRLSNALTWSRVPIDMPTDSLAELAVRRGGRLPDRDRLLFRAWLSYLRGDAVDAEQRYREVLSSRPDDVEANFYLGEVLFHWGPVFGRPSLEARTPFETVLQFEAENAGALSHLVRLAALGEDIALVHQYADRLARLNPDPAELVEVRTLESYVSHDADAIRAFEDSLGRLSARDARRLVWSLAAHTRDAEAIARLFARLDGAPFDPFVRRQARIAQALHLVALGRPSTADSVMGPNDVVTSARSIEYRAVIATLPFVAAPPARLAALERALRATDARDLTVGPGQYSLPREGIHPPRRLYLLGLLRLRQGDTLGTARYADSLAAIVWSNNRNGLFAQGFSKLLRAELLSRADRPDEALAILGLPGVEEDSNLTEITSYPKAHERFLRGELLRRIGRPAEAARWYATFPDLQLSDLMYRGIADLRSAELAEQRGDGRAALVAFTRAEKAWRNAEPSMDAWRRAARDGVRRTGGAPSAPAPGR